MRAQPLIPLLETLAAEPDRKNLIGEIRDFEALVRSNAIGRLDAEHAGLYALVVFDPLVDPEIASYLKDGLVANDAGALFVLFEHQPTRRGAYVPSGVEGLASLETESALVSFVRSFLVGKPIVFPGLLILSSLGHMSAAVYISLAQPTDSARRVDDLRRVFSLINVVASHLDDRDEFAGAIGRRMALAGVSYVRSDPLSVGERTIWLLRSLWDAKKELLALVPKIIKPV
jgi:hypothetical protein